MTRKQDPSRESNKKGSLGTFDGVFTPTMVTILGVIMYLRMGWIAGNAGLVGALLVIVLAHIITISTTLSMSSMLTNIKIKAGGAYAIISRSLGPEAGGAIGIPMYFSQAFAVAFYIIGFTELWGLYYPQHPPRLAGLVAWAALTGLSLLSARLAFRLQYIVMAVVGLSLVSFFAGPSLNPGQPLWMGDFSQASFWGTFAIFFPGVSGILAGASMSGELKDPRDNIIQGTLAAVCAGLVMYISLAYWFARQAPRELLLADNLLILELSYSREVVIAGILMAVLSSALSTLVSAPRTLAALADNRMIPFSRFLSRKASSNEPRNAVLVSALVSLSVLMAGNLDSVATLLTLFFLTTFGMINLAVFIEQATGIISFRPRLSISILVPVLGFTGSLLAMVLINSFFAGVAFLVVIAIYIWLRRKNLVSPWGDVRGGIFTALAEWAAQKAMSLPYHPRLWKPSVLVPVERPEDFRRVSRFIRDLIYPSGRMYYLTVCEKDREPCQKDLEMVDEVLLCLKEQGLFAHRIMVCNGNFETGLQLITQSLMNTFLPPNTLFVTISPEQGKRTKLIKVLNTMAGYPTGLMMLHLHPRLGFGQERRINLWLRDRSPNINLAVLSALQLTRNWNASLYLVRIVDQDSKVEKARERLIKFIEDARLPVDTRIEVHTGEFLQEIKKVPADLTILGMPVNYEDALKLADDIPHSTVFVSDSGLESALA